MPKDTSNVSYTLARADDGTIQITFNIPNRAIKKAKDAALKELGKSVEVAGFRKGKAPLKEVEKKVSQSTIINHALKNLLPRALVKAITEEKLKLAIYPRFELISAKDGEDWQVRATTCTLPDIDLGDYKKAISGASRARAIWTPDKKEDARGQSLPREEKEQEVIKILLDTVKVSVPKILIDEEVNSRLASLLEKIEKLGLTLESYLGSIGKTAEDLRRDYEIQAKNAIALNLILNKIVEVENIDINESEIDSAIQAAGADPKTAEKLNSPSQRQLIKAILARRAALDSLSSLL